MNFYAAQGVVVREFMMASGHGRADYLLLVDGKAVGKDSNQGPRNCARPRRTAAAMERATSIPSY